MFGIGLPELFIILIIALVVLGPDKLPDLARAIGKGIGEFRKATDEIKESFSTNDDLRDIKKSLSESKQELSKMVSTETAGMKAEDLAKSVSEGTFFGDKKPDDSESLDDRAETESAVEPDDPAGDGETAQENEAFDNAPEAPGEQSAVGTKPKGDSLKKANQDE